MFNHSDLICLSHLRWDFVHQRPQHLLTRCAKERRVFFVEEPYYDAPAPTLEVMSRGHNLWVARPHLPQGMTEAEADGAQKNLLSKLMHDYRIQNYWFWYYTPMAMSFTQSFQPQIVIYDCMDELSAFRGAPPQLVQREQELFRRARLVFAGGHSLYESKRKQHPHVYEFPSSVDKAHFAQALNVLTEPADQASLAHPRLGFFGVIDERLDIDLVAGIAEARPEWELVLVGPVVKIDEDTLPRRANIHYLGAKSYADLPKYLGGWDVALLPFARNEATRFISPTKTPEYLAGGKPVVSTAIRDVVHPYGVKGLVQIADSIPEFCEAIQYALNIQRHDALWRVRVQEHLAQLSWDATWDNMSRLIQKELVPVTAPLYAPQTAPLYTAG